jgi:hypothetical protein
LACGRGARTTDGGAAGGRISGESLIQQGIIGKVAVLVLELDAVRDHCSVSRTTTAALRAATRKPTAL